MRASTSALFVAAAGFVAAQDVVETTTVSVPEATTTVYEPIEEPSESVTTVTLTVSFDTVTVSEGLETTTVEYEPAPEDTETVTVAPAETTSWVRYWPELECKCPLIMSSKSIKA